MAGRRSGIRDFVERFICTDAEVLDDNQRIKIVLVEQSWHEDHQSINGQYKHLYDDDREIVAQRIAYCTDPNTGGVSSIEAMHGTACAAILKCAGPLTNWEADFWNLADFADVYLTAFPHSDLEETCNGLLSLSLGDGPDFGKGRRPKVDPLHIHADNMKFLNSALDRIIAKAESGALGAGDIIVIPHAVEDSITLPQDRAVALPITIYPTVENRIARLTKDFKISVVIPSGNSNINLDNYETPFMQMPIHRRKFFNSGLACGAVLIGEASRYHRPMSTNFGKCVDAFVGGLLRSDDANRSPGFDRELDRYYAGTSSSAVFVAAVLACVQTLRKRSDHLDVLKPFEARAHLRQWLTISIDQQRLMRPPDVLAWLLGTGLIELSDTEWEQLFLPTIK